MTNKKRETFQNRFGFVLACIGSAVGMGNIWLFPYRVGEGGGAAFLIPYFIFVFVLGFAGVAGEMAFGRAMKAGSIGAFRGASKMRGGRWGEFVGLVPTLGSLGIAIGYSVVVGWILKFLVGSVTGSLMKTKSEEYFGEISASFGSIPWHLLGLVIVFAIMLFGIAKGIEKVNKFMMPAFFCLFLILAVRVFFLEGSASGYSFLLKPKWSELGNVKTWVYALGQAFFSLSLAGSGTIVYGSYLKKDYNIPKLAISTAVLDTLAAVLASFVIMPAVFAFGLDVNAGPPLLFMTMPIIFDKMPGGTIIAIVFFLSLFFAAISSSINMLEGVVEAIISNTKLTRVKAVILVGVVTFVLSIPLNLSMTTFDNFTNLITVVVSPVMALLVLIVFYYLYDAKKALAGINEGAEKPLGNTFLYFAKYVFTIVTILVVVVSLLSIR